MCGIVGFNWDNRELLKKMTDAIIHRGPDDFGLYNDEYVSLGHRRLSIIDLSKNGRNPLWNETRDICIIFNGEIFNFIELRMDLEKKGHVFQSNTDTEVIVHSYEEYGEKCVETFLGFFAFAIYDIKARKLFLARDRIGKKPLYFYRKGKKFIFASEIKAILIDEEIKRAINSEALNYFLTFRYNPLSQTIFENIFKLKPGCTLVYDLKTNHLRIAKYWSINNLNSNIIKRQEKIVEKEILNLFHDSVKRRMISDVPIGAYLSGGIDSSAVVSMMSKVT